MSYEADSGGEIRASSGTPVHPHRLKLYPATSLEGMRDRGGEDKGPPPLPHGPYRPIRSISEPIGVREPITGQDATGLKIVQNVDLSPGFEVWEPERRSGHFL
jgi:hypothetical protein